MSDLLAAEAEAVPSSLDRLPPGFTHKKRKSEMSIERGEKKRARGSRGGVLGRPRKSETLAEDSRPASEDHLAIEQSPTQAEMPTGTSPKTARRSSRKSAASALELSTPWDPTADVLISCAGRKHSSKYSADVASSGADRASNGGSRAAEASTGTAKDTDTIKVTVDNAPFSTPTRMSLVQPSKSQVAPTSLKQKKQVSFSPEVQANDVQFFARITTSSGTKDVLLLEEDLKTEVDLVKRYAAWQKTGNSDATFEVFKDIAHFTR